MKKPEKNQGYLLDNSQQQAGLRLEAISALFDKTSFQHIQQLGIQPGWRCWEIGAGGQNLVKQLGNTVGSSGSILATDIDLTWLKDLDRPNIQIIQHDVVQDPLPEGLFDLIHARLVLVHLPERQEVLKKLITALRPGGWLLVEDADPALQPFACIDEAGQAQVLANKIRNGFRKLMEDRGVDLAFGRTLPRILREIGLQNVMAESFSPITRPECNLLEIATIHLLQDQLIEHHLASPAEIEANLANLQSGQLDITPAPLISAWGQRSQSGVADLK